MNNKFLGAILLILGTSIGAGMVALPVAAAQENYLTSLGLLFFSWLFMSFGAFALLEATLWFGKNKNIITIAKSTLGTPGQILTWFVYLFLLYSLLCAYISGISDVIHVILWSIGIHSSHWMENILSVVLLGAIIYKGIRWVDVLNRGFMGAKFIIYIILLFALSPKINFNELNNITSTIQLSTLMVMITSFGYAIIVPSIVDYLDRDHKKVRNAVLIGSLIPMIIYAIWIAIIQGVIPRTELIHIASQGRTVVELIRAMQAHTGTHWIANFANVFMSICAFTSFLGVSLSMVDFMADGTAINKKSSKGWIVYFLTFIPPLLIVIADPNIFVKALSYAGIFCVVLLIILPLAMVIFGRYRQNYQHEYRVPGGWISLCVGLLVGLILLVVLISQSVN